jgi:transcriptional regulator with XRE-family HTH domain
LPTVFPVQRQVPGLPERLKEAFGDRSLTHVAKLLDVSQASVSRWLTGERTPEAASLVRLAEVFGRSVDWFVGRGGREAGLLVSEAVVPYAEQSVLRAEVERLERELAQARVDQKATERALALTLKEAITSAVREATAEAFEGVSLDRASKPAAAKNQRKARDIKSR